MKFCNTSLIRILVFVVIQFCLIPICNSLIFAMEDQFAEMNEKYADGDLPKSKDPSLETIETVSIEKFGKYIVRLNQKYQSATKKDPDFVWYHQIPLNNEYGHAKLFLGALPIYPGGSDEKDFFSQILSEGVKSVLSVVEPFEISKRSSTRPLIRDYQNTLLPVTADMWRENDINQLIIHSQDYYPVSLSNIRKGALFVHEELLKGRSIYSRLN